jgi:hypothetical protein
MPVRVASGLGEFHPREFRIPILHMRGSDPRDEAGDFRPAELGMSGSDLVPAAVGFPGENAPKISRLVQLYSLDIPAVFRSFRLVARRCRSPKAKMQNK